MYFQIQQLTNVPITQLLCIHYNVSCPPQVPTRDQTTRETHIVWDNSPKKPCRIALSGESEHLSHITQNIDNQSINETVRQFTTIISGR